VTKFLVHNGRREEAIRKVPVLFWFKDNRLSFFVICLLFQIVVIDLKTFIIVTDQVEMKVFCVVAVWPTQNRMKPSLFGSWELAWKNRIVQALIRATAPLILQQFVWFCNQFIFDLTLLLCIIQLHNYYICSVYF
jgi:hypothetical protein